MEEDIKVLEKYVEKDIPCNSCKYCTERPKVAGALRNLIKRNKELEEKVNKYEKQIDLEWVEENYIEKSKVKEARNKFDEMVQKMYARKKEITDNDVFILFDELLEGDK